MPNPSSPSGPDPRRILVRGVNWLGDSVMTAPALQRLRERFPRSHIALLTNEALADLWQLHPSVNEVITITKGEGLRSVAAKLRPGAFDLALVLPNSPRSALEVWLARIPTRAGFARPWRNWFLTQAVPARTGVLRMRKRSIREIRRLAASGPSSAATVTGNDHQMHEYLRLVAALEANPAPVAPRLELAVEELEAFKQKWLEPFSNDNRTTSRPGSPVWLGLNPSAAYGPAKRWPVENFSAVARETSRRDPNCVWLLVGGSEDRRLCEEIAQQAGTPVLDLAGKTSLRELMAALKLCRVLLTNDSGPMHVAAALGTPVVALFGSTSPALTGPGLPGDPRHQLLSSNAPCAPCFRRECPIDFRCMTGITVDRVAAAVWREATKSPA